MNDQTYTDTNLVCQDCGKLFMDTAKDQAFREQQGWNTPPKRCKACRAIKKANHETKGGVYERATEG